MPEMSGPVLVEKIKERHPRIGVVYMSGYAEDAIVSHANLDPTIPFVHKPVSAANLLRKIAEELGRVNEKKLN
jgi:two-component system cell cycle sensor histidine kinase/response regulator CckA